MLCHVRRSPSCHLGQQHRRFPQSSRQDRRTLTSEGKSLIPVWKKILDEHLVCKSSIFFPHPFNPPRRSALAPIFPTRPDAPREPHIRPKNKISATPPPTIPAANDARLAKYTPVYPGDAILPVRDIIWNSPRLNFTPPPRRTGCGPQLRAAVCRFCYSSF